MNDPIVENPRDSSRLCGWRLTLQRLAAILVGVCTGWLGWMFSSHNDAAFYFGFAIGATVALFLASTKSGIIRCVVWVVAGIGTSILIKVGTKGAVAVNQISVPTTIICVSLAICVAIVVGHDPNSDRLEHER